MPGAAAAAAVRVALDEPPSRGDHDRRPSRDRPENRGQGRADPRVLELCTPVLYGRILHARRPAGTSPAKGAHRVREKRRSSRRSRTPFAGDVDAIATAPVNKAAFALAGPAVAGHTELLAHLTGAPSGGDDVPCGRPAASYWPRSTNRWLGAAFADARVAPPGDSAGVHGSCRGSGSASGLAVVAASIRTQERAGCSAPRNSASSSRQSRRVRAEGIRVAGPFPADTLFVRAVARRVRRGHRVLPRSRTHPGEAAGLRKAVHVTAGAADHPHVGGSRTAFDIAGRNAPDPGSMNPKPYLAARLARAPVTTGAGAEGRRERPDAREKSDRKKAEGNHRRNRKAHHDYTARDVRSGHALVGTR